MNRHGAGKIGNNSGVWNLSRWNTYYSSILNERKPDHVKPSSTEFVLQSLFTDFHLCYCVIECKTCNIIGRESIPVSVD